MRALRKRVFDNDVAAWSSAFLAALEQARANHETTEHETTEHETTDHAERTT